MKKYKQPNVTELATSPDFLRYLWVATMIDEDEYVATRTSSTWIRLRAMHLCGGSEPMITHLKFIDLIDNKVYVINVKYIWQLLEAWREAYFDKDGFNIKPFCQ